MPTDGHATREESLIALLSNIIKIFNWAKGHNVSGYKVNGRYRVFHFQSDHFNPVLLENRNILVITRKSSTNGLHGPIDKTKPEDNIQCFYCDLKNSPKSIVKIKENGSLSGFDDLSSVNKDLVIMSLHQIKIHQKSTQ